MQPNKTVVILLNFEKKTKYSNKVKVKSELTKILTAKTPNMCVNVLNAVSEIFITDLFFKKSN